MTFHTLGLSKGLIATLASKKYADPTPIQRDAIPLVLSGRDLLGIAQTGTGKTAAFMLPSIERLMASARGGRPMPGSIRMLVLVPTRELASQIAEAARAYAANTRLSVGVIFGGVPVGKSVREVSRGLDVLVSTPGRLLDLADRRSLDLSRLETLVLDEADQMLDLGFIHALKAIVKLVPATRQTLFFSATMPKSIRQLADAYLRNPAQVAVTPVASTAERVEQSVTFVNQGEKQALLAAFFRSTNVERALVFSRTKHGADKIVRFLAAAGIDANAIHGNKSQSQRERALDLFRSGEVPVLIATDIAARGIDIPGVSHVLNFDLPNVPEQYVHRIGRTARAGAKGIAIAFCSDEERGHLRDIERLTRQRIVVQPLPADFAVTAEALKRLKPAPAKAPRQQVNPHAKSHRRAESQRRAQRNDRQKQRHPHRGEGHEAHRSDGGEAKRMMPGRRRRPAGARYHSGGPKG
jgi:ATP-dependent RNA helicase RhlE